MKILYTLLLTTLVFTASYAQQVDTLLVLKAKSIDYINHELIKPKTYIPNVWSKIMNLPDGKLLLMHAFKAKNKSGKLVQLVYSFNFDSDLELISVNTDSPEKQLKEARVKKQQAEDEIKRIKETRDRKIEALTNGN
ncbi:MAG: hypothetical protein V4560_08685 [Bacteroidota bacterium]|jgi:hypothetical protein